MKSEKMSLLLVKVENPVGDEKIAILLAKNLDDIRAEKARRKQEIKKEFS